MTWRDTRRKLLALHRWLGGLSAIFLLSVSLTGLALNHTELLGLDKHAIHAPFILKRYGMSTGSAIVSVPLSSGRTLSRLGGRIYLDDQPLTTAGAILGVREESDFAVVVTDAGFVLFTPEGEVVEQVDLAALPMEQITAVAAAPTGEPVLIDGDQRWLVTGGWLSYEPYAGDYSVTALPTADLSPELRTALLTSFQGDGVPLYRVILDLHSGRLFGWVGRLLMDLTAVAVVILVSSGLFTWIRTSRGRNKREAAA